MTADLGICEIPGIDDTVLDIEGGDKDSSFDFDAIKSNIRLVMSISKKCSDQTNVFYDMLSEGIASLMNAVEKFDFDRGFRFSTYATTSVQRDLYRSVAKSRELSCRFNTGADLAFSAIPAEATVTNQKEAAERKAYNSLMEMIKQLDPREKIIILARFGFDSEGGRKRTFTSQLDISKERVRQLADRAVTRLRAIAPEFGIAEIEI